jgi:hypothetical protein
MIRKYNNPIKARVWRPRLASWMKKQFPDQNRRSLSAICLAGPELLEVEHIYKPLGFGHVTAIEIDTGHYKRMCDKRREMIRDGHTLPEIEVVHADVREHLAVTSSRHDVIFLDFDGLSHLIVNECARTVARRRLLAENGGAFGVCVLGVREHLEQQLAMKSRAKEGLTNIEQIELINSVISQDPIIRNLLKDKTGHVRRKGPAPKANSDNESDLYNARDVFYTNLVARNLFRGRGLDDLSEIISRDDIIKGYINECLHYALKQLQNTFVMDHVDKLALSKRLTVLLVEVVMFEVPEAYDYLLDRMGAIIRNMAKRGDLRAGIKDLSRGDIFRYLVAKYLQPYLCKEMLSLHYSWGNSPMYTDIGMFVPLTGFENKLALRIREVPGEGSKPRNVLEPSTGKEELVRSDLRAIKKIREKRLEFKARFDEMRIGQRREILRMDAAMLDPSLPILNSTEQIEPLVEHNPLISADEVFEQYNCIGMDWRQVYEAIRKKLGKMGLKVPSEKKKERLRVRFVARMELGATNKDIEEEFYENASSVKFHREQMEAGIYGKGGKFEHLRPFIEIEKRSLRQMMPKGSCSSIYESFVNWANDNVENVELVSGNSQLEHMRKIDEEVATADNSTLLSIVDAFSEYEPYSIKPYELLHIAAAIKAGGSEISQNTLEGLAKQASTLLEERVEDLSSMYPQFDFTTNLEEKITINPADVNLFLECFGYFVICNQANAVE